jgi:hypothetical protein
MIEIKLFCDKCGERIDGARLAARAAAPTAIGLTFPPDFRPPFPPVRGQVG